jgi:hypothetical protein
MLALQELDRDGKMVLDVLYEPILPGGDARGRDNRPA